MNYMIMKGRKNYLKCDIIEFLHMLETRFEMKRQPHNEVKVRTHSLMDM